MDGEPDRCRSRQDTDRRRRATRWAILLTTVVAVAIAVLTLTPPVETGMPAGSDKLYHFVAFGALAFPLATVRPRWNAALFFLFTGFGAAIEIIQPYVGRTRELADLGTDMVGLAAGIVAGSLLRRLALRRRGDSHPRG